MMNRADLIEGRFSAANPGLVTTTIQLLWFELTKTENDSFSLELTDRAPNNSAQGPVLESPSNFSGPGSFSALVVFAFKIKVSII